MEGLVFGILVFCMFNMKIERICIQFSVQVLVEEFEDGGTVPASSPAPARLNSLRLLESFTFSSMPLAVAGRKGAAGCGFLS